MATFFQSRADGLAGGTRPSGYDTNMFLDASIISQLQGLGYILSPTSLNADYAYSNFQQINKAVAGDRTVPALQDRTGNTYILDDRKNVYMLQKSAVDPGSGLPNNNSMGGGNSGTPNIDPPIYRNDPPVLPPVLPNPPVSPQPPIYRDPVNNGGGGSIPPTPTAPGGVIGSGQIYTQFQLDDIVPNQQEIVTRALWSGNDDGNLTDFFTSSLQTSTQKRYYYEIYNSSSIDSCGSQAQFSVAYGHKLGSGSADEGGQINDTPSRAIYGQYRQLCLEPNTSYFTIGGNTTNQIYAINVNRARMREYLDEGNLEINLAYLSGSQFVATHPANAHTGSNVRKDGTGRVLRLIDDSSTTPATIGTSGEVYNIVSGSIEDGVYNPSNPQIFGLLYKRLGVVILNADKLDATASFATVTGSEINGDNAYKLFTSISASAQYTDASGDILGFQGRGAEKVKSTHFFCRVKNQHYNFSNNPSFVTGSEGDLTHPTMINDPRTYITTVGLYNGKKECVAVAKLSQPIQKSFINEALIKIKLDF